MTRVAIQGIRGSYSDDAVGEIFGASAVIVECTDFAQTFAAVTAGTADNAVVPVRNKIVGDIAGSVRLLHECDLKIVGELSLKVRHVLAGTWEAEFDRVTSVRSHVEALRQCGNFLNAHPRLVRVIGADTASSIRRIVNGDDPTAAAIGSRRAAELYGAKIICEDIADDPDNWTTFYLLEK